MDPSQLSPEIQRRILRNAIDALRNP